MMAEALEKQYSAGKVRKAQEEMLQMAQDAVRQSPADQTQIRLIASDNALTRFANSEIHQNTFEREAVVQVLARNGQRQGQVTTNRLTPAALKEAAERATAAAKISEPNPDLADLPEGPRKYPLQIVFSEATAACTPEERGAMVVAGLGVCENGEYKAAGTLTTGQVNVVIVNSRGIEVAYSTTSARYTVQWTGANSSGYSECSSRNVGELDTVGAAVEALAVAKRSANPRADLPAGRYPVILMPECIATMLSFLTWVGFSGRDYNDQSSFMCGKFGELITGRDITITDDPLDVRTMGLPCDMAGVPKQRLSLIENGVARAVAHDSNSAAKAGVASTGHDSGQNWPAPMNLTLSPGTATKDELIQGLKRGVLVNRFHYTNVVDPMATVITGMTRDGTFLIEDGELAAGLTNFRFTQNILKALADNTGIGGELVYHGSFWGAGCLVPEAIRIEEFNFSGKSEH
jgi:PmbA protein